MSAKRNYRTEGIGLQSITGIVLENGGSFNIDHESNRFCLSVVLYNSDALAGFVKYSDNNAVYEGGVLAPPYGYFAPEESCGVPVLKYGYPGC